MYEGEKRIKRIERDIGRQIVGDFLYYIKHSGRKEISRREASTICTRKMRINKHTMNDMLDILETRGRVKKTRKKVKLI